MASRIQGITVEIGGDTTKLSKALESVNKSIKGTQSGLKDVNKLLKLDPSNTELVVQKQKMLKDAIEATKEKLATLKTAAQQANEQLANGEITQQQYDALQREIVETEQNLRSLQDQAATTNATLAKIDEAGEKLQNIGSSVENVGKKFLPVTAAVTGLGTAAVKTAADFDSEMSKVSAISGATGDDFDQLRAKAREMGAKTKFSASEAASAMEYMAMAGWKTSDMLNGIEGVMNLAAASGEDLATTSDIVTDALTAFGLSAADSGHFADILAAASSNANTNVSMMGETFKYCAPIAGALGFSAEDTAEAIGLMANSGIKASQAGTSLRTIMNNLSGEVTFVGKNIGEVTIATSNADGSMRSLNDILADCRVAFSGLSESEKAANAEALVGKNAMSGFLALMNSSQSDIDKLSSAIENCDGASESMAETMQDNLNGQLTILKSQLEELAISFGDILMPTIRKIVSAVQQFVDKLNSMDEGTRETIIKIGLLAASIGPLLIVLGKTISTVGTAMRGFSSLAKGVRLLITHVGSASGVFSKLGVVLGGLSGPVVAVVAVIGTLVAAVMNLWNTNEEFRTAITSIWNDIVSKVKGFCDQLTQRINGLGFDFKDVTEVLKAVWDGLCQVLAPLFEGAFQNISTILGVVLDTLLGLFDVFSNVFSGNWSGAWEAAKGIFSSIWDGVKSIFSTTLTALKSALDVFLGLFGTDWQTVWGSIKNFFETVWNGISSFFSNTVSAIQSVATTVFTAVSSFFTTVLTSIQTTFSTIWTAISTAVSSVLNTIHTTVTTVWTAISTAISTVMNTISTTITSVWNGIYNTMKPLLDAFQYLFETIWQAIQILIGAALTAIQTKITSIWNAIVAFVTPILTGLQTTFSTVWSAIQTAISTVLTAIQTAVTTVWNAIVSFLTPLLTGIQTRMSTAWNAIKTVISTVLSAIQSTVSSIWSAISSKISGVVNGIKSVVSSGWNAMKSTVSSLSNSIKSAATTAFNSMKSGISSTISGIKTTITNGFNSAVSFIKGLAGQAFSWGSDMIGNIVSGIQSRIQDVASAVSGVADRIRSFLHFSVPDEGPLADMESWMPDFMQGLANGITTNTSLVTAAAENLSTTLSTSITNSMRGVEQAYSKSWAAISQTVKTGTAGVSAAMKSAWSSITTSTASTWNSIKTTIQTSFAAVKTNVTSATAAVKTSMTSAWNAVKSLTTTSWNGIKTVITTAWNGIKSLTTSATASVKSSMTSAWNAVKTLTNTSWNGIKTVITTAWNSIKSLTTSSVSTVRSTVTSSWNTLKSTTTSAFNSIKSTVSSAMSSLRSTVSSGVANIRSSFNSLGSIASSAYRWGADICSQMAAGVRAATGSVIAAAENVASRVRSLLHFSVPDEGPLSDADTYMPDFMKLLATGIKKNVKSVVKAVQGLAGSMSSNLTTPVDSLGDWMDSVVGSFATTIKRSQSGVGSAARDVGSGIQSQLMAGLSGLKTQFQQLWTDLQGITKTAVGSMSDEVKQGFTDIKDSIGELSSQTGSLGNAIRSLGDTFNSDFLKSLGNGISKVGDTVNTVTGLVDKLGSMKNTIPASVRSVQNGGQLKSQTNIRVAAYCRVSTGDESQQTSYTTQKAFYKDLITRKPGWIFAGIYADEAKSGTNREHREEFNRMIKDAMDGKLDYIVTKSISRFARNTIDSLTCTRELRQLKPPVGIYFEKENIDTLDAKGELILTILSALAQDESRSISDNIRWSIQKKFQSGVPHINLKRMLGYELGENKQWVIVPEQAEIIRYIFDRFVKGQTANKIAQELNQMEKFTVNGKKWSASSILIVLRNEKYVGDIEMQKTITKDFLTHRSSINKGEAPRYYVKNHHVGIIDRVTWDKVQTMLFEKPRADMTKGPGKKKVKSIKGSPFGNLRCGAILENGPDAGKPCGEGFFRTTYTGVANGYSDERSLKATGEDTGEYLEKYTYSYPVWRCKRKVGERDGEPPKNGSPDQKAYCRSKKGCMSDEEKEAANKRCPSERYHECALEQSFMELLYSMKRDFEQHGDASMIVTMFDNAYEQAVRLANNNSISVQRMATVENQIKEMEERLQDAISHQVAALREAALEQNVELNEALSNGEVTIDDIDLDIRSGLTPGSIGVSFYGTETEEGSEAQIYTELVNDLQERLKTLQQERQTIEEEQGVLAIMKKNFEYFLACLKELPDTNAGGMPLRVNGLDVQGSLLRDVDGKPIEGRVSAVTRGRLKLTPERIAEAPDMLHFEKGIYCAFVESGVLQGDVATYKTNFGVTLTSKGNRRTLDSFMGYKRSDMDGNVVYVDAPYKVYGFSIQYRRYLTTAAKREREEAV